MESATLICRHTFDAQNLVDSHPPEFKNANKKIVYAIACPPGSTHRGEIVFARWQTMSFPETFSASSDRTVLEIRNDYFGYEPSNEDNEVEWYLNFAHSDLFCAYGSPLFAQDEMQVTEHPALGSLREALLSEGIEPLTVENEQPTPVLIRGVERRCAIATDPNPEQGRPLGLYGNNFARASKEAIELATKVINPPTITNIIAMEAPAGGYGSYSREDIEYILITAFTGFLAAKIESKLASTQQPKVVIHTGFWGCGAYGGDRILMSLLQLLAAHLAQVNRLVFHTGNANGADKLITAQKLLEQDLAPVDSQVKISDLITKIEAMGFQWGVSDGN